MGTRTGIPLSSTEEASRTGREGWLGPWEETSHRAVWSAPGTPEHKSPPRGQARPGHCQPPHPLDLPEPGLRPGTREPRLTHPQLCRVPVLRVLGAEAGSRLKCHRSHLPRAEPPGDVGSAGSSWAGRRWNCWAQHLPAAGASLHAGDHIGSAGRCDQPRGAGHSAGPMAVL